MTDRKRIEFTFPVGYHEFHEKQIFNFQLNRWYSLGYARFEDMQEAGGRINSFAEWKAEMLRQAEKAVAEDRLMNAAFYYRAAEFYTSHDDPDKALLYDRFIDLFYNVFRDEGIERFTVPYDGAFLPAMRVSPAAGEKRSTIVIHGGFDSFIEEFYSWMRYFADLGYEVIAFEGPGQGGARRKYGIPLDYRWELPTGTVLDYFGLKDVHGRVLLPQGGCTRDPNQESHRVSHRLRLHAVPEHSRTATGQAILPVPARVLELGSTQEDGEGRDAPLVNREPDVHGGQEDAHGGDGYCAATQREEPSLRACAAGRPDSHRQ